MQLQTVGGVDLHYYSVCQRKLWFYKKGINMEDESDRVLQGKILHETSYNYIENREILIDDAFKLDAIEGEFVREVKMSSKMKEADELQILFYLYQLWLRGVEKKGLISYTKEKKTVTVSLTEENKDKVVKAISHTYEIISQPSPLPLKKVTYCRSCAYYGLCYAKEEDDYDA